MRAAGELDRAAVHVFRRATANPEQRCRRVVVDLAGLTFLDASAVRELVSLEARSRRDGFALSIVAPGWPASRIFALAGVADRLPLETA